MNVEEKTWAERFCATSGEVSLVSRVGRKPIEVPSEVKVSIVGAEATVKGPKGTLQFQIPFPITAEVSDGEIQVRRPGDGSVERSLHGTVRAVLSNMVEGVSKGFEKLLQIEGLGYRARQEGKAVVLTVGYSHPVHFNSPEDVELEVIRDTQIAVRGIDKQKVGETAAKIRRVRPPEPYKGKGIRYSGERVKIKPGKAGV